MFELVLRAPAAMVEPLSDLLMDEVNALLDNPATPAGDK